MTIPGFRWIGVVGERASGKGGGVGFLVKEKVWNSVREVGEVNSRIFGMCLETSSGSCWLFQVYAPVNDAGDDEKESFWGRLRDEVEFRRRGAKVIVMGDVNGRVGNRQEDWEIVGRHGEEEINENGESCLELCRGSELVVMNR